MIHLVNLLHTLSLYANRWGGPRYRVTEFMKLINKHLYHKQEQELTNQLKVNAKLIPEAFLSANHTPYYLNSIQQVNYDAVLYEIRDEYGFCALFTKGTEILVVDDKDMMKYVPIEQIKTGWHRVVNFELVPELRNDKLHHHTKFNEQFLTISCACSDVQQILCDALTSMTLVKEVSPGKLRKVAQFDSRNVQELYLLEITSVAKSKMTTYDYELEFMPFSHVLVKDRKNSKKSNKRYYKAIQSDKPRRYLDKMRSKVFEVKKSKYEIEMELIHEKDRH